MKILFKKTSIKINEVLKPTIGLHVQKNLLKNIVALCGFKIILLTLKKNLEFLP